ncbi:outer membrane porin [mine drainage metagenome]|uniref:Outer membrane porin n=4 Tax=mine drainage metagenome TaxID=410659 RepID=T1C729_9ZZZZ
MGVSFWPSVTCAHSGDPAPIVLPGIGTLSGEIRDYDFSRWYESPSAPADQHANALGGLFNFHSVRFGGGFRAGLSFYDATDIFGLNNSAEGGRFLDTTLYGSQSIQSLGQAFLAYQRASFLVQGGAEEISTPWMGASDSRMVPATYEAILSRWVIRQGLSLEAIREFRWKSRTSSRFSATTLYNANGFAGIYGGQPNSQVRQETNPGTLALGTALSRSGMQGGLWYYHFYGYAQMVYGTGALTLPVAQNLDLSLAFQALHEWSSAGNLIHTRVSGTVYGASLGFGSSGNRLTLSYDQIPVNPAVFHAGDLVSPYSAGYATDPLFTTSMIAGLVEKASGQAAKLGWSYFVGHTLRFILSEASYWTAPAFPDTHETDLDVTWYVPGRLRGLSLRNRLGMLQGVNGQDGSPNLGTFLYDRVMITYRF